MTRGAVRFGCDDHRLDIDDWCDVIEAVAAHLRTIDEDLYDESWDEVDEGCRLVADRQRVDRVEAALHDFEGPIYVVRCDECAEEDA